MIETGGLYLGSVLLQFLPFMLGYLLILVSPGPNMLALGCIAALHGLRGAMPMILGIALGGGALAIVVQQILGTVATEAALMGPLRMIGGLLLLCVAAATLRAPAVVPAGALARGAATPQRRPPLGHALAGFLAGFWTAATNPITCAYFMARLPVPATGGERDLTPALEIVALLVAALFLYWLAVGALLAHAVIRRFVAARQAPIRMVAATAIGVMGAAMMLPALAGTLTHAAMP